MGYLWSFALHGIIHVLLICILCNCNIYMYKNETLAIQLQAKEFREGDLIHLYFRQTDVLVSIVCLNVEV